MFAIIDITNIGGKMTEQEIIKIFNYEGFDISAYAGTIKVVNTDESSLIDTSKNIATTSTFSCTNMLIYNNDFAYLVHMLPSETVGKNNRLDQRVEDIKRFFINKKVTEANVLISLGASVDYEKNMNFHNLDHLNAKLFSLAGFCNQNDIVLSILPVVRSKYLLFDLEKQLLFIDNKNKKAIHVEELENHKNILTNISNEKNNIRR